MQENISRSVASLYALAMGDAYGVAFEFMPPDEIAKKFPTMPMYSIGGGPFEFEEGEFSDDTEMAALTLESVRREGCVDVIKIKTLYTLWAHVAKDIGIQTRSALIDNHLDPRGEGNGALMRVLPAAAYMYDTLEWSIDQIKYEIARISAITHDNETIHAVNNFFIDLMLGNSLEAHKDLIEAFNLTIGSDGWVMNTARIVYKIYQARDISLFEGFTNIIQYGGDTDTACAIYGAIRGYQNPDIITEELKSKLLSLDSLLQLKEMNNCELHKYSPEPSQPLLNAGQYPGSKYRIIHALKMAYLLDLEIDTIINLMEDEELKRFTPYANALQSIKPGIEIYPYPIRDMDVPKEQLLLKAVDTINQNISNGKKVYVHCWGGHGRTGTIVGSWLVKAGMNPGDAVNQIMTQRKLTPFGDVPSPQTSEQMNMIFRMADMSHRAI